MAIDCSAKNVFHVCQWILALKRVLDDCNSAPRTPHERFLLGTWANELGWNPEWDAGAEKSCMRGACMERETRHKARSARERKREGQKAS